MKFRIIAVMFLTVAATGNAAGEGVDLSVVNRIKDEAFNHSQVMVYMHHLADENGPRLAASPAYQRSARWAVETLQASGISDARLEPFGEFGRSWAWTGISVQMVEPQKTTLNAVPLAWSSGTNGTINANVVYAPLWDDISDPQQGDLVRLAERIDSYKAQNAGRLGGKFVLLSGKRPFKLPSEPEIQRWSESDLAGMQTAREPVTSDVYEWPLLRMHLGDPRTMELKPEQEKFSVYFNIDTGSGKTRGILTQGNDMVKPIFGGLMEPFIENGVSMLVPRNDWGTDHQAFDAIGLPAFDLLQDQLDYWSHTHHSNVDTVDHVLPQDLMVSAAFMATLMYDAATRKEMIPREPLPRPLPEPSPLPDILLE